MVSNVVHVCMYLVFPRNIQGNGHGRKASTHCLLACSIPQSCYYNLPFDISHLVQLVHSGMSSNCRKLCLSFLPYLVFLLESFGLKYLLASITKCKANYDTHLVHSPGGLPQLRQEKPHSAVAPAPKINKQTTETIL